MAKIIGNNYTEEHYVIYFKNLRLINDKVKNILEELRKFWIFNVNLIN